MPSPLRILGALLVAACSTPGEAPAPTETPTPTDPAEESPEAPCSTARAAQVRDSLEVRWAPETRALPAAIAPPDWVTLSFDMRDGATGARVQPLTEYPPGSIHWDTDPPHVYLRGAVRPPIGSSGARAVQWRDRARCRRRFGVHDSALEVRVDCCEGRLVTTAFPRGAEGASAVLIDVPDQEGLMSTLTWAGDWDGDGRMELLVELSRPEGNGVPDFVGVYRVDESRIERLGATSPGGQRGASR